MSSCWPSENIWTTRTWTSSWLHTGTLSCRYTRTPTSPNMLFFFLKHANYVYFMRVSLCLCLQIALKCADVCNPCRVWELSRQWSERVCEEFYRQGEKHFLSVQTSLFNIKRWLRETWNVYAVFMSYGRVEIQKSPHVNDIRQLKLAVWVSKLMSFDKHNAIFIKFRVHFLGKPTLADVRHHCF